MFNLFLIIHITAGFSALLTFWLPLVLKKGGKWHIRVGWFFVVMMGIVSITAVGMAFIRIFIQPDTSPERFSFSIFLLFIAVLSASTAYYGLRVLRFKRKSDRHRHLGDLAFSSLLFLSGLSCSIYGFSSGNTLISFFPFLGIFLGLGQLAYWLRPMPVRNSWLLEHIQGMIACSISTVTAFTVFGAPRLLGGGFRSIYLWILPTIVLVPLIFYFSRKYRGQARA
ncbi:DUF2306 domain-containing protein [Alkalihalobacillus macyae]|uniref:DUF2306 domain-containing protein n=1 Tax=Guptibacillus hwajinpoensis TaxID=208199 RepID=UPI00273B8B9A|nr:DUF2306 domain-containing protein [Alkalihalobacillus macyae]MDP4551607.1 DUF2306 domain-containing protein [Alkalihalobacillus macyae]